MAPQAADTAAIGRGPRVTGSETDKEWGYVHDKYLMGRESGRLELPGLWPTGRYEARIYDGGTKKILARYPFTVVAR